MCKTENSTDLVLRNRHPIHHPPIPRMDGLTQRQHIVLQRDPLRLRRRRVHAQALLHHGVEVGEALDGFVGEVGTGGENFVAEAGLGDYDDERGKQEGEERGEMVMIRTWTSLCRASSQSVKVSDPAMVSLPTRTSVQICGVNVSQRNRKTETEEMKDVIKQRPSAVNKIKTRA